MPLSSRQVFEQHFSIDSLKEIVDSHLSPSVARGVDGTSYDRFMDMRDDEVSLISSRALGGGYIFSPYRQKLILKGADSLPRCVVIPTIRDKVALRALNNFLNEVFESSRPPHTHSVVSKAIKSLGASAPTDALIKLDIKSFYDKINHNVLLGNLRRRIRHEPSLALVMAAIKMSSGNSKRAGVVNELGVPQGLSISNILASIYLQSIDEKYESMMGIEYHRYVDDILCVSSATEAKYFAEAISKDIKRFKKLDTHALGSGKSEITTLPEGVMYLGYAFKGKVVSVRPETEKKLLSSLIRIIQAATVDNMERSLWRLNLRISGCRLNDSNVGWMYYFSQINDVGLLFRLDHQVKKRVVRKFGPAEYSRCKRLVKSFYKVQYNFRDNDYAVNFDKYSKSEMVALLNRVFPGRFDGVSGKPEIEVRRIFNRVVTREVREMERDTLGGVS